MIVFPIGRAATADPLARFMEKVEPEPMSGCWLWLGPMSRTGYSRFKIGGKAVAAYRWLYERVVRPIPAGLEPDHRCRLRSCVNPGHIDEVTRSENMMRSDHRCRRKTHCARGHLFDKIASHDHPRRVCSVCQRDATRAYRERKRA